MEIYSESKIRYLEMIQNIIIRMASNSFALKGWAITIITGIFALANKDAEKEFFLITYIPLIMFWLLDSYYLQLERKYRCLYKTSLTIENEKIVMNLTPPMSCEKDKTEFRQSFISATEIWFYLPLAIIVVLVICLVM